jgi:hypothetical protein
VDRGDQDSRTLADALGVTCPRSCHPRTREVTRRVARSAASRVPASTPSQGREGRPPRPSRSRTAAVLSVGWTGEVPHPGSGTVTAHPRGASWVERGGHGGIGDMPPGRCRRNGQVRRARLSTPPSSNRGELLQWSGQSRRIGETVCRPPPPLIRRHCRRPWSKLGHVRCLPAGHGSPCRHPPRLTRSAQRRGCTVRRPLRPPDLHHGSPRSP